MSAIRSITAAETQSMAVQSAPAIAAYAAQAAPGGVASPGAASHATATAYSPTPSAAAQLSGGGGLMEMVGWAQSRMDGVQNKINSLFQSEGEIDPGKLSVFNSELSRFQLIMEELRKVQQTREDSARVWVR